MATWEEVKDAVAKNDEAVARVLAKLEDMKGRLADMPAGPSPEEFGALVDSLHKDADEMATALTEAPKVEVPAEEPKAEEPAPEAPVEAPVEPTPAADVPTDVAE